MIKLAIVGGIGSGKSVVSRMLEIMGVPVYDCDSRAKELMVKNPTIIKELKRMFGDECYDENGCLDRKYLASRIFVDERNTKRVNALVHPVVKSDFCSWTEQQDAPIVAVETALLYESGMVDVVDKVLLVWADKESAIEHICFFYDRVNIPNKLVNTIYSIDMFRCAISVFMTCSISAVKVNKEKIRLFIFDIVADDRSEFLVSCCCVRNIHKLFNNSLCNWIPVTV